MKISYKVLLIVFTLLFLFLGIFLYQNIKFSDGKLHVVFCNVGQGDGIFIRTPKGADILVDGGPDNKILDCLSSHMPFWDRTIELAILTHPHADHLTGLIDVLKRYSVLSFATEKVENKSMGFQELMRRIGSENVPVRYLSEGDSLKTREGVRFYIIGPSQKFIKRTSPEGMIGESREFASLITLVSYGNFDLLLTGDSQKEGLLEGLKDYKINSLEVLQVPHHGSKYGLGLEIFSFISPKLAVISVGRNNRYGHPHRDTSVLLREQGVKVLRTDLNGEIELLTDGQALMHSSLTSGKTGFFEVPPR